MCNTPQTIQELCTVLAIPLDASDIGMKSHSRKKQACRCSHPKTIHQVFNGTLASRKRNPCRFPGCTCKDYKRAKTRA